MRWQACPATFRQKVPELCQAFTSAGISAANAGVWPRIHWPTDRVHRLQPATNREACELVENELHTVGASREVISMNPKSMRFYSGVREVVTEDASEESPVDSAAIGSAVGEANREIVV